MQKPVTPSFRPCTFSRALRKLNVARMSSRNFSSSTRCIKPMARSSWS